MFNPQEYYASLDLFEHPLTIRYNGRSPTESLLGQFLLGDSGGLPIDFVSSEFCSLSYPLDVFMPKGADYQSLPLEAALFQRV
jgi:hypothetical protein